MKQQWLPPTPEEEALQQPDYTPWDAIQMLFDPQTIAQRGLTKGIGRTASIVSSKAPEWQKTFSAFKEPLIEAYHKSKKPFVRKAIEEIDYKSLYSPDPLGTYFFPSWFKPKKGTWFDETTKNVQKAYLKFKNPLNLDNISLDKMNELLDKVSSRTSNQGIKEDIELTKKTISKYWDSKEKSPVNMSNKQWAKKLFWSDGIRRAFLLSEEPQWAMREFLIENGYDGIIDTKKIIHSDESAYVSLLDETFKLPKELYKEYKETIR